MPVSSHLPAREPVLIVGAGPAGATAARRLALAGVPVTLLDRSAFPRNKPCGGGISARVVPRFPYLEGELSRIATHEISRLYLEGPSGQSTIITSDAPAALMIRRVEFDALLVSLAVAAGARLVAGADVVQARQDADQTTLTTRDGREFTSRTVIVADGVHSLVGRRLGLNPGWPATAVALDMMEETPRTALRDVDPSTLWIAYGYAPGAPDAETNGSDTDRRTSPAAPEGYAYIFPKRDHVNIGIGYVLSYFRREIDASPYELQQGFVDRLRARGIVVGESVRSNFTPFLIPVGGPLSRPGRGRVLLAGDAGGFVNGFTAEGIYYAMVSGDVAAQTIVDDGADPRRELADAYRRRVSREIGAELRDSVLIQRYLFGDRRRVSGVIHHAPHAATTRLILDFAMGRCSYTDLRRRILFRSPRLAVRIAWERARQLAARAAG